MRISDWSSDVCSSDLLDALVEYLLFLFRSHGDGVLVAVTVDADLVPGVCHRLHLLRKGLDGMTRNEPGGPDPEAVEEFQQARRSDLAGEQAARDVVG